MTTGPSRTSFIGSRQGLPASSAISERVPALKNAVRRRFTVDVRWSAHGIASRAVVAGSEQLDDLPVFLVSRIVSELHRHVLVTLGVQPQLFDHPQPPWRVDTTVNEEVEVAVQRNDLVGLLALVGDVDPVEDIAEQLEVAFGAGACAANGLALQLDPQLVEVFEVGDRQRRHPRAPVVAEDDETFGFENPQRLAHRDEAGAAPLGDCLREQLRVVRVLAADDAAAEVLHDVMDGAVPVTAACCGGGVYLRLRGPNHGWYIIQL